MSQMNGSIIEDEDMVIMRVVSCKHLHSLCDILEKVLVYKIPILILSRIEIYMSRLCFVW